jgi:hypothetical protein
MAMNTGAPYEVITRLIFQQILNQDSMRTVKVEHNVTLAGKTLRHQIDVFWAFEFGGIQYETVVQAKDWNKAVDQGELLKFQAVLDDLAGQPRGIFVTRTGYQRGAEEFARANGIVLYELADLRDAPRSPPMVLTDVSYAYVRIVAVYPSYAVSEVSISDPKFSNIVLHGDKAWFEGIKAQFGNRVAKEVQSSQVCGSPRDIPLYDGGGKQTQTLRDVYANLVEEMRDQGVLERNARIDFEQSTYFKTSCLEVPLGKVSAISTRIEIRETVQQRIIHTNFVEWMLKNLNDGTLKRFAIPRAAMPKKTIES